MYIYSKKSTGLVFHQHKKIWFLSSSDWLFFYWSIFVIALVTEILFVWCFFFTSFWKPRIIWAHFTCYHIRHKMHLIDLSFFESFLQGLEMFSELISILVQIWRYLTAVTIITLKHYDSHSKHLHYIKKN